jgi:myo-inositol-1(or 4)-monophosphatase
MFHMLDFAITLAREAGVLLQQGFRGERQLNFKSRAELVTDMDIASEQLIVQKIAARFPEHQIITEEGGGREHASRWVWLVDPLDGTTNYAHGYPFWSVSIALLKDDRLKLGVVYDPVHDECFAATDDGAALLNGRAIQVSTTRELHNALLTTGFSYERWTGGATNVPQVSAMVMECRDLRRMGSAALDLCYVAAGRSDGYWEVKVNPWDVAAGALLVQRAGGHVTTLEGEPYHPWQSSVMASNRLLHPAMSAVLQVNK